MNGKKTTTFRKLRSVYVGPQGIRPTTREGWKPANPVQQGIQQAVNRGNSASRGYRVFKEVSRKDAVDKAEVVVTMGPTNAGFGKPTLRLQGELTPTTHSDKIREFLNSTGATSVAFAIADNQPYWRIFNVIARVFDWTKPNRSIFTEDERKDIRKLYAGGMLQREIAVKFNVTQTAICFIVTGQTNKACFKSVRDKGYVSLGTIVVETGAVWPDAVTKCKDLKIEPETVGPRSYMIKGADKRRLKLALVRVVVARDKRRERREVSCAQGHPWSDRNLYYSPSKPNRKRCRACYRIRSKKRYDRLKLAKAS